MLSSGRVRLCVVAVLVVVVRATQDLEDMTDLPEVTTEVPAEPGAGSALTLLEDAFAECADEEAGCARDRLAKLADHLESLPSVELLPGLASLKRTSENDTREDVDGDPGDRLVCYLRTHVVEVWLPLGAERVVSRVLKDSDPSLGVDLVTESVQAQGRGRIRKLVLPLMLLLNLKSFVVVPVLLSAVLLVAFKGLWAGLAAFLVSGAIGLRQLFNGKDDAGPSTRFTVGVVKPHIVPEVFHHGPAPDYWHGWSRSGPPLPPPTHDAYPYRGYYPPPSATWGDRPLVP